MAPRKKVEQEQTAPLFIGYFGPGEIDATEVDAHLTDYLTSVDPNNEREITFIIPVTKSGWNDTTAAVVEFVTASQLTFEAVTDKESAAGRGAVPAALKKAEKVHEVARIGQKVMAELTKKEGGKLLAVAWPAEGVADDEFEAVVAKAVEAEIPIRDLVDGFTEVNVTFGDEGSETSDVVETGEAEEFTPYTEDELNEREVDVLKQIAADFQIEVPARSRKPTYVKLILEAQEAVLGDTGSGETGPTITAGGPGLEMPKGINIPGPGEIANAVVEALFGDGGPLADLDDALGDINEKLDKLSEAIDQVDEGIMDVMNSSPPPAKEPEDEPEPEPAPAARPARRLPVRR